MSRPCPAAVSLSLAQFVLNKVKEFPSLEDAVKDTFMPATGYTSQQLAATVRGIFFKLQSVRPSNHI